MNFVDAVRTCFAKYADFNGRAGRPEYWWWVLFVVVGSMVLGGLAPKLSAVFTLATLIPGFAAATRRLHDTDKSGWHQLVGLIPIVGWLIVIYWLVQEGKPTTRYDG